MKKLFPIMITICLVFLIHCNQNKSRDIEEVILNPKNDFVNVEFKKEKSVLFTKISYGRLFIYNDRLNGKADIYVYGYDSGRKQKLVTKKYDNNLNLISTKAFPFGQGPGDVGTGTTFCQVGDYIYGPDSVIRRVNIFDKNFNYLKFEKVIAPYNSTAFSKDGNYFFGFDIKEVPEGYTHYFVRSTFPGLKKKRIFCVGTFWIWNEHKKYILGSHPLVSFFLKKERIYFLNPSEYMIVLFDMNGNKLKQVRLNVSKRKVPKEKKKEWLFEQLGNYGVKKCDLANEIQPASWAIPLEKGFVVIRRNDYSTVCRGMVEADYFDYELNLMGKTGVPCFYRIFQIKSSLMPDTYHYQDGYLYLIYENEEAEEFYLEKWKVEERL